MIVTALVVAVAVIVDGAVRAVKHPVFHRMATTGRAPVGMAASLTLAARSATMLAAGIVACGAMAAATTAATAATAAPVAAAMILCDEHLGGSGRLPAWRGERQGGEQ